MHDEPELSWSRLINLTESEACLMPISREIALI